MEKITLRGPQDVLASLPFLIGYHPRRSVVVMTLTSSGAGSALGPVARLDLPPTGRAEDAVLALVGPLLRSRPRAAVLVGYEDRPGQSDATLEALSGAFGAAGVDVVEALVVRDGHWFARRCHFGCCPAQEGSPLPHPADVPAVAALVADERAPLEHRDAVTALVGADPDASRGVAAALGLLRGQHAPDPRGRATELWARFLDVGDEGRVGPLDPAEVARLAGSLDDARWRDGLIAGLCPESLPPDLLDERTRREVDLLLAAGERDDPRTERAVAHRRVQARLLALCRAVPDDCPREAAAVCTLAACVAWAGGEGAVARDAVERALRLRPTYRLARLMEQLIALAVPPVRAPLRRV